MLSTIRKTVSGGLRAVGQSMDSLGAVFELNPVMEKLMPSTRVLPFAKSIPNMGDVFVASSASVIGNVKIGDNTSVWYGAVVRGDVNSITIGDNVSVGDRVMIHGSGGAKNAPVSIGNGVVIKAGAVVHGCSVADGVVIGEGAQVMDGTKLGKNAMIAPGAVVPENSNIGEGTLWSGVPAKYIRDLTTQEIQANATLVIENVDMAILHSEEDAKSWEQIEEDAYNLEQEKGRNSYFFKRLTKEEMSFQVGEVDSSHMVPGRVLDSAVSSRHKEESRPFGSGGQA